MAGDAAPETTSDLAADPATEPVESPGQLGSRRVGPGARIGPYALLQRIGKGGMGVVYLAEQVEPVRRQVALKIIRPGMDSDQVLGRFEAERLALALMDHPHIARVLDVGTTDAGRPYFVMELVQGVPITRYCDANQLAPRDRLELFISVCEAIQHAHQKGIRHGSTAKMPARAGISSPHPAPIRRATDAGAPGRHDSRLSGVID